MVRLKVGFFGIILVLIILFSFVNVSAESLNSDLSDISCKDDEEYYPFGFRKNSSYCGYDKETYKRHEMINVNFFKQKKSGEECIHSFECESNFCNNGKCFNGNISKLISLKDEIDKLKQRISELENKINQENQVKEQNKEENQEKEEMKKEEQLNNSKNLQGNKEGENKENNSKGGIGGFFRRLFS